MPSDATDNQIARQQPYYVCWYLTYRCNLSCGFCYAFKNGTEPLRDCLYQTGDALLAQGVKKVNLMGGEPFLSPYLFDVVARYSNHVGLSITTNGTFLTEDSVARLVGKLDRLTVSLDAVTPGIAQEIRGRNYDVSAVLKGLKLACIRGIPLKINTIVMKKNISELARIGSFLNSLNCHLVWKLFQITKNINVKVDIEDLRIEAETIRQFTSECVCILPRIRVVAADSNELSSMYIIVTPDGDVHIPCFGNYGTLGNVCDATLDDIVSPLGFDFRGNRLMYGRGNPVPGNYNECGQSHMYIGDIAYEYRTYSKDGRLYVSVTPPRAVHIWHSGRNRDSY